MSLIEFTLVVITVAVVVIACGVVWAVARLTERNAQSEERHRLKAENAALRMLLKHNGIKLPDEMGVT